MKSSESEYYLVVLFDSRAKRGWEEDDGREAIVKVVDELSMTACSTSCIEQRGKSWWIMYSTVKACRFVWQKVQARPEGEGIRRYV